VSVITKMSKQILYCVCHLKNYILVSQIAAVLFAMVYAATAERRVVDGAIIEEVLEDGIFLPAVHVAGDAAE
jgi:hypothetical protein